MARAITLQDTVYEVDNGTPSTAATTVLTTMLLRMDAFNLGTEATKLKKSATTSPAIPAHVTANLNVKEFGIHPRTIELEALVGTPAESDCYGGQQKRKVIIVVPTLEQFNKFKAYDKIKKGDQAETKIKVSHSYNGKKEAEYLIMKKNPQFMV